MLIVQMDEPGLFVFPSASAAVREIEPIDAEQEIRAVFDESAVPYRVNWLLPNRRSKRLFGLLESVVNGQYELVPAGAPDPERLRALLERHPDHTTPPDAKPALDALLAKLRAV